MNYTKKKQAQLYETKDYSDCTFIFPSTNVKIKAHKFLLMLNSPVFESMLFSDMAQSEILIEDIEPAIFEKFLKYIYTSGIQLENMAEAWNLFYVSQKYFLPDLKNECLQFIKTNLTISNLLMCYEYSTLYGQDKLSQECLDDIWCFGKGLLLCGNDYHPQLPTLRTIAQNDTLEASLMIVNWALTELDETTSSDSNNNTVSNIIKENKLFLSKHFVDPRLYKALSAEQQDVVEVYNELTTHSLQIAKPQSLQPNKHHFKFKVRPEFKNAYRLALRGTNETLTSKICCTCDCLIFGVSITTKSKPEQVSDLDYMGGASVCVYLKDNETLSNLIFKQPGRYSYVNYDDVQNIVFDVPILCKAYVSYMICVEYIAQTHGESILLTYMGDKLSNAGNKSKSVICFGDEPNGSVIKGLCFYEV